VVELRGGRRFIAFTTAFEEAMFVPYDIQGGKLALRGLKTRLRVILRAELGEAWERVKSKDK
jgi:hypothetical protein